jgi:hypothetical protein
VIRRADLLSLTVAVYLTVGIAPAQAGYVAGSPLLCASYGEPDWGFIQPGYYEQFTTISDIGTMTILCPLPILAQGSYGYVNVAGAHIDYRDFSWSAIACWVYKSSSTGSVTWSSPRYSCGQAGGCPTDSDPTWSSDDSLEWGGASLAGISPIYIFNNAGIYCNVPSSVFPLSGLGQYYVWN